MRDAVSVSAGGINVNYQWQIGGTWCQATAAANGPSLPLANDSVEEFIAEHYWGYGRQRNGELVEYHVSHPPWHHWRTAEFSLTGDFHRLYGSPWGEVLNQPAASVFLADGSAVQVYPPK